MFQYDSVSVTTYMKLECPKDIIEVTMSALRKMPRTTK
jgi:hypothetical protein